MHDLTDLVDNLRRHRPQVNFVAGDGFRWSPRHHTVFYDPHATDHAGLWTLLHETGHALLGHDGYRLDFELLELELAAWERAVTLAAVFDIIIPAGHIQDCLDTYRNWIYRRSICPHCEAVALQRDTDHRYACHNCSSSWRVSPSRFCRPYRALAAAR